MGAEAHHSKTQPKPSFMKGCVDPNEGWCREQPWAHRPKLNAATFTELSMKLQMQRRFNFTAPATCIVFLDLVFELKQTKAMNHFTFEIRTHLKNGTETNNAKNRGSEITSGNCITSTFKLEPTPCV